MRWTEGRNIEAYLDLVARGKLHVDDLVTHTFGIDEADKAYEVIAEDSRALAVQFTYSPNGSAERLSRCVRDPAAGRHGIIGAGNFAKMTLLPAMKKVGFDNIARRDFQWGTECPPPRRATRHRGRGVECR